MICHLHGAHDDSLVNKFIMFNIKFIIHNRRSIIFDRKPIIFDRKSIIVDRKSIIVDRKFIMFLTLSTWYASRFPSSLKQTPPVLPGGCECHRVQFSVEFSSFWLQIPSFFAVKSIVLTHLVVITLPEREELRAAKSIIFSTKSIIFSTKSIIFSVEIHLPSCPPGATWRWQCRSSRRIQCDFRGCSRRSWCTQRRSHCTKCIMLNTKLMIFNAKFMRFNTHLNSSTSSPGCLSDDKCTSSWSGAVFTRTPNGPHTRINLPFGDQLQNSSFSMQNPSFLIQNSSFLIQNSWFLTHFTPWMSPL